MELVLGVILLFSLIFVANVAEARRTERLKRLFNWILLLVNLPIFLMGLALLLVPPQQLEATTVGVTFSAFRPAGLVLLLSAVWGLLVTLPEARRLMTRVMPIDPTSPVHALALVLAGYLIGNSVVTLTQGGLEGLAQTSSAATILDIVASELLYAMVGVAGVGLFVRRQGWKLLDRLGLQMPSREQLRGSIRWVLILVALQWLMGAIFLFTNPEQAEALDNLNTLLLENIDTPAEWFVLALSAALGEEILFRGALQPVFGLWATAFLFAMAHIQYGLTLATLLVFVIGVVLGLIRRRYNTGVAIFVHFSYNFILGLLALLAPYLEQLATT